MRIYLFVTLVLLVVAPHSLRAQVTGPGATPGGIAPIGSAERPSAIISSDAMIFEGAIDPREYHMGPGDILQMQLWGSNQTVSVTVSPEQEVILPRVGAFEVRGMSLQDLKDSVYRRAAKEFPNSNGSAVSLTLLQPRRIFIKVSGNVLSPNVYTVSASTRADIAVDLANKPGLDAHTQADQQQEMLLYRQQKEAQKLKPYFGGREDQPASQRYITVVHVDGTSDRADLVRYNATHDPAACPLLREGDVVYVPYRNSATGSVGVYGEVQNPGDYEFVAGDSLSSLIRYAFGPTVNADLRHVELTRASRDGQFDTRTLDLNAFHSPSDMLARPGDRIIVRSMNVDAVEALQAPVVLVDGAGIQHPGMYPITPSSTKLSEVVRKAGGLMPNAFVEGGTIYRRGHQQRPTVGTPAEVTAIQRLSNFSVYDTANFRRQMETRQPTVAVDMRKLFASGDSSADVTLRDGDEVVIEGRPTNVYVFGFVNSSGFVPYVAGAKALHYIAAAGGFAEGAVSGHTRVIKAKSKAWLDPSDTQVEPGDEIYVPKEGDYSEDYSLRTTATILGIASAITGLGLTLYGIFVKK